MRDNRKKEFFNGLEIDEYPTLNKIIGTGWYSSRITINLDEVDIKPGNFMDKSKLFARYSSCYFRHWYSWIIFLFTYF